MLEADQLLCGVTGMCGYGSVELNIGMGSVTERIPLSRPAHEDSYLLGIDFLIRIRACVNFLEKKLGVCDKKELLVLEGDAPVGVRNQSEQ